MLLTDLKHNFVRTFQSPTTGMDLGRVGELLTQMRNEAVQTLQAEGVAADRIAIDYAADVRYVGQSNEVEVSLLSGGAAPPAVNADAVAAMVAAFHEQHQARFGYAMPGAPTEVVNLRAEARGRTDKPALQAPAAGGTAATALKGRRPVFAGEGFVSAPVYAAGGLGPGARLGGPAIVEQATTTIFVPADFELTCEAGGNYLMTRAGDDLNEILARLRR